MARSYGLVLSPLLARLATLARAGFMILANLLARPSHHGYRRVCGSLVRVMDMVLASGMARLPHLVPASKLARAMCLVLAFTLARASHVVLAASLARSLLLVPVFTVARSYFLVLAS